MIDTVGLVQNLLFLSCTNPKQKTQLQVHIRACEHIQAHIWVWEHRHAHKSAHKRLRATEGNWQLLTATDPYCRLLTANDKYWHLLTDTDSYWQLLSATNTYQATYTYWQLVIHTDTYWHLLTPTDTYRHLLIPNDSYWHLLTATDSYWQLLSPSLTCCAATSVAALAAWPFLVQLIVGVGWPGGRGAYEEEQSQGYNRRTTYESYLSRHTSESLKDIGKILETRPQSSKNAQKLNFFCKVHDVDKITLLFSFQ